MTSPTVNEPNPYDALERLFHEPKRLALVSSLCAAPNGMTFGELKAECDLTDGNLSRHLKTLEESRVVKIRKAFVDSKPRTTVLLSAAGRERFIQYLDSLERVLSQAIEAAGTTRDEAGVPLAKPMSC